MMKIISKLIGWFNSTATLSAEEMIFMEMCNLS